MKVLNRIILLVASVLVLSSCSEIPKELTVGEYREWFSEHHEQFHYSKIINQMEYELMLTPYEVLLSESDSILFTEYNKKINEDKSLMKVVLRIKVPGEIDPLQYNTKSKEEYFSRLNYYSFDVKNDVFIKSEEKTIKCHDVMYMRTYGLQPEIQMILNIPFNYHKENFSDLTFLLQDVVFGSGDVQIKLNSNVINNIPKLIEE